MNGLFINNTYNAAKYRYIMAKFFNKMLKLNKKHVKHNKIMIMKYAGG